MLDCMNGTALFFIASKGVEMAILTSNKGKNLLASLLASAVKNDLLNPLILKAIERRFDKEENVAYLRPSQPPGCVRDRFVLGRALIKSLNRSLIDSRTPASVRRALFLFLFETLLPNPRVRKAREEFRERYGADLPGFLVISPGKACNLNCKGCYAGSGPSREKLRWDVFDWLVTEMENRWGSRFVVISGGEPFIYRSEGKGILEMAQKHRGSYFMVYTNGTLIDEKMAERLADLGNVTPAISVEGFEETTNERRGKGVYARIIEAMRNLRDAGVPFGISVTATRQNLHEITSSEFADFYFDEMRATYGWIFQYMPIGRAYTLDYMLNAEERLYLWRKTWEMILEKGVFISDFWNHGPAVLGCIAAGRGGGYLYVNWNGDVTPCVFIPYSPVNLNEIYEKGGTINDIWDQPFFAEIRRWQRNYGYDKPADEVNNWLAPCLIRDHHLEFREFLRKHSPKPIDESAEKALQDDEYVRGMEEFDREYGTLSGEIWDRYYRKPVPFEIIFEETSEIGARAK